MGSGIVKRLAKEQGPILDRVNNLEKEHVRLLTALQKSFETTDNMLKSLSEILSAVVAILGPDEVTKAIDDARQAAKEKEILKAKAALEGFVADGTVVIAPVVGPQSLVVGHETLPDGKDSGRLQFLFKDLAEDRQAALLNKTVNDVIPFPSGSSFKVTEIYNVVEKPVVEKPVVQEPVVEPAPEAVSN